MGAETETEMMTVEETSLLLTASYQISEGV